MKVRKILTPAALVGGLASLRGSSRWLKSLDAPTGHDELVTAVTDDGWRLSMARYRAAGATKGVVVAGHGFAGSSLIWDLAPEVSLARHLASEGYDFYALDLRGRGRSWPGSGPSRDLAWSFDDFVFHDLPAAIGTAASTSESDNVFWLGLEMSGQALYAAQISGTLPLRLNGAITLGSPVVTPAGAKVPGVTAPPQARRKGRVMFRAGAHYAGPILALLRSKQLESSFVPANVDPFVPARYLRNGIPDESTLIADQFRDWVDNDTMRSLDRSVTWADQLAKVDLPLLMMAAARDLQRPPAGVKAAFDAMGSNDKTFIEAGRASGFSVDFGHDDLVAAKVSPHEVFPKIAAWLDERC